MWRVGNQGKPAAVSHLMGRIQSDIAKLKNSYEGALETLTTKAQKLDAKKEVVN